MTSGRVVRSVPNAGVIEHGYSSGEAKRPLFTGGVMKSSTNLRKHLPLAAIVLAACSGPALAAQTLLSAAEVREIDQVAQTAVNSQTTRVQQNRVHSGDHVFLNSAP